MTAILFSAVVTCVVALFLGQAALRLAGAREWSWLAPQVGISIAMLAAVPAIHVPGRCSTVAVLLGGLTIAAIIWCSLERVHRPPGYGLLAATPVALLLLIPFLSVDRGGILGTSLNNDMAAHMSYVEAYLSQTVANVTPLPLDYPLGPHAMVALLAEGGGIRVDQAFAGWTIALPILNAWTALALVRPVSRFGQIVAATVVGLPFLIAAYYGQGAFKEVLLAGLVLAVALLFSGYGPALKTGRWLPFAFLVGGIVSVYSVTGLPWPLLLGGFWLMGVMTVRITHRGVDGLWLSIREEIPALGIAAAVLLVTLLPQLPRLERYVSLRSGTNGTGIAKSNLGNLIGPLPGWEALGVWNNPDFRLPAAPAFTGGMWAAFVLALVLFGAIWAIRQGRWMLPLAAAGSMLIWAVSANSQSPYVVAKALVIASPLVLSLAVLPLVERSPNRQPSWMITPVLLLVLLVRVGLSDVHALRISPVGPTEHLGELRALRPTVEGQPTLFLGNDDYAPWELAGVPLGTPVLNAAQQLPMRPGKEWSYGKALDFDSVEAAILNQYGWVITTRDAAGSAPPPQLRLVRTTKSYALWRRTGTVIERSVLDEGDLGGAVLDCRTRAGHALLRSGGVAAIRRKPRVMPPLTIGAGGTVSLKVALQRGVWELEAPYVSPLPVVVSYGSFHVTLPANLDRVGPRWRIGKVIVEKRVPATLKFHVEKPSLLTPESTAAIVAKVVATPVAPQKVVPLRDACGHYVDWYRAAPTTS